jgi:hypothetical protein
VRRGVIDRAICVIGGSKFSNKDNPIIFFPKDVDNVHLPIKMKKIFDILNQSSILVKFRSWSMEDIKIVKKIVQQIMSV